MTAFVPVNASGDPEIPDSMLDESPDEIRSFFDSLGVTGIKYHCMIRRVKLGGGGYDTLSTIAGRAPTIDEVGESYGPGEYRIGFTWYDKNAPGKSKTVIQEVTVSLPEIPWRRRHVLHLDKLRREDEAATDADRRRRLEDSALRAVELGGKGGAGSLKETIELLASLGYGPQQQRPTDWGALLTGGAAIVAALSPLFRRESEIKLSDILAMSQQNTQTLMTALSMNKPQGMDHMNGLVEMALGTAKKFAQLAGAPVVEEKEETVVDRVFGLIESVGPALIGALAQKTPEARAKDPIYKIAKGSEELQEIKKDPELVERLVNGLDQRFGYDSTNKVLEAFAELGLERPESTLKNAELYPSPEAASET